MPVPVIDGPVTGHPRTHSVNRWSSAWRSGLRAIGKVNCVTLRSVFGRHPSVRTVVFSVSAVSSGDESRRLLAHSGGRTMAGMGPGPSTLRRVLGNSHRTPVW